jgi:hypothetical protein
VGLLGITLQFLGLVVNEEKGVFVVNKDLVEILHLLFLIYIPINFCQVLI